MKAVVKVKGFVQFLDIIDSKYYPFVTRNDDDSFWIIGEDDELEYFPEHHIKQVIEFK